MVSAYPFSSACEVKYLTMSFECSITVVLNNVQYPLMAEYSNPHYSGGG